MKILEERIEKEGKIRLHNKLKEGYKSIYGWTSDDQGIRHGLKEDPNVDYKDARFMLVVCSAFVNYLVEECSQKKIKLYLPKPI